ncbi:FeoB-associated Cys-rich membrane protein [Desulfovibrio sp. Huiquan2017]|uniref:FeoB-associated Cys-rich membrane protein n=1 Tax=Desulfovibrio sp. Huiquan2017 TaxID=2816861 RepID=UPI001A92C953|nr:FeoB-associated Cys-rich membrane protein [Desulfovibrio sp. Huiquan2017]
MLDTIIVGAIIAIAAFFVGRRLLRSFTAKQPSCGCGGCGQSGSCSGAKDGPGKHDCCGSR